MSSLHFPFLYFCKLVFARYKTKRRTIIPTHMDRTSIINKLDSAQCSIRYWMAVIIHVDAFDSGSWRVLFSQSFDFILFHKFHLAFLLSLLVDFSKDQLFIYILEIGWMFINAFVGFIKN